jgi:hypothetical protein
MQELPEDRWKHLFTGESSRSNEEHQNLTPGTEAMYGHLELSAIKEAMPSPDNLQRPFEPGRPLHSQDNE